MSEETKNKSQSAVPPHESDEFHDAIDVKSVKPAGMGSVLIFVTGGVLLLAALFFVGYVPQRAQREKVVAQAQEYARGATVVDVGHAKVQDISGQIVLPADVQAYAQTAIYARATGYLLKQNVEIGDRVEAGQVLAELDTPELRGQLNQAKANLLLAKANADKAQEDLNLAKQTLDRFEELAATKAIPPQQLDERRAAFIQAKAALAASTASIASSEASVSHFTTLLSFQKVYAPFAGTITSRNYDLGALVTANTPGSGKPLFDLVQSDPLRVFVNLPQTSMAMVKNGQVAKLTVRNDPGRVFDGSVTRSAGALDATTRTLRLEIQFPNPDRALLPGMYGQVSLAISQDHPPLVVPSSALVVDAEGLRLALVENGKIHYRKITMGRDMGTSAEVLSGITPEDVIVLNPTSGLNDGDEVQISQVNKPAANGETKK